MFPASSRVGAARMRAAIAVLACIVLCGNATAAATRYAVTGLLLGSQLSFESPLYRDYRCSPSDRFAGLTRCEQTRNDRERRGTYSAAYSILHTGDGTVLYVDRFQEPAFFGPDEVEDDIRRYSRQIGRWPRIMPMHARNGTDGIIAVWGNVTLEQLDRESAKTAADATGRKDALLIDFLGDFARSTSEGLPIYRISGGPGFLWAASFDQKGRGTLRLTAVDASGIPAPSPEQQRAVDPSEVRSKTETNRLAAIERLETALAKANETIAKLERAKAEAETAHIEAARARAAAEIAKRESERNRIAEQGRLDPALARQQASGTTAELKRSPGENALYGAIGGLLTTLTGTAIAFVVKRRKAGIRKQCKVGEISVDAGTQSQSASANVALHAPSPQAAASEAAFRSALEAQAVALNTAQDAAGGRWRLLSPKPRMEMIWKNRWPLSSGANEGLPV
jgi:hypothetical protein